MKTLLGTPEHDDSNLFKRCGCIDAATGRRHGSLCPQLADPGHGAWYYSVELPPQYGRRQRLRRGGYATCAQARTARDQMLGCPTGLAAGRAWTLQRWLRHWLGDITDFLRPTTVNGYTQHARLYLAPQLGHVILAELTTRQVQNTLKILSERRPDGDLISAATIRRVLATLRSALGAAVREGLITANVAAAARAPRPSSTHAMLWTKRRERNWRVDGIRPTVAVWDIHHVAAFFNHTREDRTFALWWVALLCGLRRGELAGLRWCDIDLEDKTLTVAGQTICIAGRVYRQPPKSVTSKRTITLDDATVAVLQKHRDLQDQESFTGRYGSQGHVFTTIAGRPMRPSTMSHQFLKAVRSSGLPPVRLHDLRHAAATLAFAAKADLKHVQERLGHSSPVTTAKIYISVLSDVDNRQAQATARMILDAAKRRPEPGTSQA